MPTTVIRRDLIRAQLNVRTTNEWQDQLTSASPDIWLGTDLAIQIGIFADAAFSTIVDGAAYSSITVEVKEADDKAGAALMAKTIAGPFVNPSASGWADGSEQHAEAVFTFEETNISLGDEDSKQFWLVISAITTDLPARNVTLGCTTLTVKQDGHEAGGSAPPIGDPLYLTAAESDARYVPFSGGTMTGALTWSGTNHFGIRNISLTTTQRDLLTAAAGHVIYNSTTARTEFYDNGAWRSYVRLAGDTMTGHLLFTDNTYDIGASGATRPRTVYAGTSMIAPTFTGNLTGNVTGAASDNLLKAGGTMTGALLFTDNTIDIGAAGATRPRTVYVGTSVVSPLFTGALTGAASSNVLKGGDTMTGFLILHSNPSAAMHAATKQYVDAVAGGALTGYIRSDSITNVDDVNFIISDSTGSEFFTIDAQTYVAEPAKIWDGNFMPNQFSRIGKEEILTNKTLDEAVFSGSQTGTATFEGTFTYAQPILSGDVTGTAEFEGTFTHRVPNIIDGVLNFGYGATGAGSGGVQRLSNLGGGTSVPAALLAITPQLGVWRTFNFGLYEATLNTWAADTETVMRYLDFTNSIAAIRGYSFGIAALDGSAKIPIAQLPDSIVGQVEYQGTWDANSNLPTIPTAATGNKGWYYVVATAGSSSQGGITDWKVGDWLISNGTAWEKVDNTDAVSSVAGRIGAINLTGVDMLLTSYVVGANTTIADTDTVNQAFGKTQAQITARLPLAGGTMTGALLFTDNTVDIGASGATRPRRIYVATEVVAPLVTSTSFVGALTGAASSNVLKAGDTMTGALLFTNNAVDIGDATHQVRSVYVGTSIILAADAILVRDAAAVLALKNSTTAQEFRVYGTTTGPKYVSLKHNGTDAILDTNSGKVQLGGTATVIGISGLTSSFAGIKSTTGSRLQVRLADDSAMATLESKNWVESVAALTPGASVNIDFLGAATQTIALNQNTTLTTSNRAAGRSVKVVLLDDGSARTLTFPGWMVFGTALPAAMTASKTGRLTLFCTDTTDAGVHAAFVEQV